MEQKMITGGLLFILKISRVAWYRGSDGVTAYYEHPTTNADGAIWLNGRRHCELFIDKAGLYLDYPSPRVREELLKHGVSLTEGWACGIREEGIDVNSALAQSVYKVAVHVNGLICMQRVGPCEVVVFTRKQKHSDWIRLWNVDPRVTIVAVQVFKELNVFVNFGWVPSLEMEAL